MGVLFAMPSWSAHSELWMQRMLEEIEPHLVAVAALAPTERAWRGRVPAVTLGLGQPARLGRRLLRGFGVKAVPYAGVVSVGAMRRAVDDAAVTVVLVHYVDFALAFQEVWASASKPVYVHCHGYDVTWDLRQSANPEQTVFPEDYINRVRQLAEEVTLIANSKRTEQRLLAAGIPGERIRVKYLGVAVSPQCKREPKTGGLEILYLGRLVDFKGPDLVVRAFIRACSRGLDAHLTIAGDGYMRAACELLAAESSYADRITMIGYVGAARADALRRQADIFTAHNCQGPRSRQEEAFGVAIIEAMASGLPVISGRNGSLPEVVDQGVTGLLVEPGDVDAHADAFLLLGSEPHMRLAMGEAGRRRVEARFSLDRERTALLGILGLQTPGT
jgi:colanic acid/amylovoran biosynthesis glycosyltransferase